MNNLVIVESPTKARTLTKFLGSDYRIEASMGHIRDLPKGELGVDVDNNFEPRYIIPRDKKKKVNELKKLAASAKHLWLATDPDREGEAIAWHLEHILGGTPSTNRVEFHEITENAIKDAFKHPRTIDSKLVDAQQARRILDRLVGYKLSPLLWRKVKRGLSAGRVQTVTLRLIVEREREIKAFVPVEYWDIEAQVAVSLDAKKSFFVQLVDLNGKRLDIWSQEKAKKENLFFIRSQAEAQNHINILNKATYNISSVEKKEVKRYAPAPFTTSTMQQAAGNRLGFTAKRTMMVAQNLYEQGFITYMRTDSVNLSKQAIDSIRSMISTQYGKNYLPEKPKLYHSKSKNAQEAHEAIRPTNAELSPNELNADGFTKDHQRLYELIWKRTVASQMSDAIFDQTTISVSAQNGADKYGFRATGSILKFDGWLKLYGVSLETSTKSEVKPADGDDTQEDESKSKNQLLPEVSENEALDLLKLLPEQHSTQPPPRYTESSLIKKLEELGIGRPSTYAPTLATIQDRYYVEKVEKKFKPTVLGTTTNDFLIKYFPDLFDYSFTASMEDRLDDIANGQGEWKKTIKTFYDPMEKKLESVEETAEKVNLPVETVDKKCPECGKQLLVRTGKFGKFLACTGFPECKHTEPLEEKIDAKCPTDGGDVVVRKTKKGRIFYGCKNYPKCTWASWVKPKSETPEPESTAPTK